jgi:quinolinate synthase
VTSINLNKNLLADSGSKENVCAPEVLLPPWVGADPFVGYGPGSSMGDMIPAGSPRQGAIPQEYRDASDEELDARIAAAKATLGDRVVVLGHYYQRDEVVKHAESILRSQWGHRLHLLKRESCS